MQRIFLFALFLCLHWVAWGQESYEYRYWFDYEDAESQTGTLLSGEQQLSIDLTGLNDALHAFRFQVKNSEGVWSVPITRHFLKMPTIENCTTYYWFDDDAIRHELNNAVGSNVIDVSHLKDGIHLIYFQTDGKSSLSSIITKMFIKIPQTVGIDYLNCVCYIDGQLYKQEHVASNNGAVVWNFDVSSLPLGLHRIQLQVITPSGVATNIADRFFFRTTTTKEQESMQLVYCLDGTTFEVQKGTAVDGVFHFDVDVASLADGLHSISYMLSSNTGTSTKTSNSFFWKTPVGGPAIIAYSYWLNDLDSEIKTVTLEERANPFNLVSLLPVESQPIRSSCFHFAVSDGVPTMFAKNDFHIAFYDVSNRRVDDTKQFVDYNVSQAVEGITDLQSTQTFARPQANTVKWYKFEGEKGDTVAFRSSQAMSLQLYAPSGKELYSTSADKSVNYGGCHIWEDGTYYVAAHDVTGTKQNVTLDFMHMDRYDVVAQDVHTVGNGGCSTITFQGNGFDELESVTLVSDTELLCDSITHTSNVDVSVHFDFTGLAVGNYDAVFQYKEGVKRVDNCLTIEEAKPITLNGKVTFNSQYLRSRNNDYVIRLTNNGNSTAYGVPLAFAIFTSSLSDLNYVDISGVDYYAQLRNNLPQLFTKSFCDSINMAMESHGVLPILVKKDSVDYIDGFAAMHKAVMTVDLQPNTTKTITISLNAGHKAFLYAWYPSDWKVLAGKAQKNSIRRATVIDDAICGLATDKANKCAQNEMLIENGMDPIYNVDCSDSDPSKDCPPPPGGGGSIPVNSLDPNDIYGYTSESGSKYIADLVQNVNYRIEFENDTTFATASAHVVEIKDTLDRNLFDLATFAPTGIKIGDKTEYLDGTPNFVTTIDMRPAINAIAQVEGKYDPSKGIATWAFTSLDPMTMEPTDDVMQGFLPVNHDGISGIGEVSYNISLKNVLVDGTEIPNRASIVFDSNDPIMTPVWTNTVDAVSPTSRVVSLQQQNDTILTINLEGADERSGVWKYEVYAQYGKEAPWWKIGECTADSAQVDFRYYNGIDYGFCVLATDSAGNVEDKELAREANIQTFKAGDVNGDDEVNAFDVMLVQSKYLGQDVELNVDAADVNGDGEINVFDTILIQDIYLSTVTMNARRFNVVRQRKQKVE